MEQATSGRIMRPRQFTRRYEYLAQTKFEANRPSMFSLGLASPKSIFAPFKDLVSFFRE